MPRSEDPNTKIIAGNLMFRRFAYLHKKDHDRFGLLEASDSKNARQHLGSQFHIRQTWLTTNEEHNTDCRERKWEIVASIFLSPLSEAYIGSTKRLLPNRPSRSNKR